MDPNFSNPKDPAAPTANVVVDPPVVSEPVVLPPQLAPQAPVQQPSTLPPVQPLPVQNTPLPTTPQPSQSEPVAPPADTNFDGLPKKHIISKKVAAVALVLFLAVTIPLTVFVANRQQNTKSGATNTITNATVVGSFNGSQFTVGTLKDVILEQYGTGSLYNSDTIKIARDIYVERKILDTKEAELGLSVSQADIDSLAKETGLTLTQAKYELLKQKVIISQVNYVKAVSIGYWVPPSGEVTNYSSLDQQAIQKQIQEGNAAMTQVQNVLANQDPLTLAQSIYNNPSYPYLKPVLSLNGSKFAQIPDADMQTAAEPVLYEFGDTNFDQATRDILFGAAKGTVVGNKADSSSGGASVFKITDKGSGTFNSYKDWLSKQKSSVYNQVSF